MQLAEGSKLLEEWSPQPWHHAWTMSRGYHIHKLLRLRNHLLRGRLHAKACVESPRIEAPRDTTRWSPKESWQFFDGQGRNSAGSWDIFIIGTGMVEPSSTCCCSGPFALRNWENIHELRDTIHASTCYSGNEFLSASKILSFGSSDLEFWPGGIKRDCTIPGVVSSSEVNDQLHGIAWRIKDTLWWSLGCTCCSRGIRMESIATSPWHLLMRLLQALRSGTRRGHLIDPQRGALLQDRQFLCMWGCNFYSF